MNIKSNLKKKTIFFGIAHIKSTFNNTIITITDVKGNTITWASAGSVGFKGAKRSTSYAAQATAEILGKRTLEYGIRSIKIRLKGLGDGCESAVRGLHSSGLIVTSIKDVNSIPHNGCRPRKRRRK